jgi:integrase/recombinase XerD
MHSYVRFNRGLARQYDRWMVAMHYANQTQRMYRKVVRQYVEFIGKRSIATAHHTDIRNYIARVSENGASLNAVYRDLGVLRQFYDFLNLGGVVSYVAPRYVRLRRPWGNSLRPLTESQVQRVISVARTLRERALVEFLYATGCRLSEARCLKVEYIDFPSKSAEVIGKLGKIRTVLLTESASDALRAYIADRKTGFVFREDLPVQKGCLYLQDGQWKSKWASYAGPDGVRTHYTKCLGPIEQLSHEAAKKKHEENIASLSLVRPPRNYALSAMTIREIIVQMASRAGLKNVTPHTFRRTFATHLYDHGASVEVIKALMGHVWLQTTMVYARVGPDRVAKVFEQCHPRRQLNDQQASK